jgi:hypothetical protein
MSKIHRTTKTAGQTPEEGLRPEEGEEEEAPQDSRITARKTHTSIVSIMAEDTALKGVLKQRKTWQEFSKKRH